MQSIIKQKVNKVNIIFLKKKNKQIKENGKKE